MTEHKTDANDEVLDLAEARGRRFLADLERGKYPALTAGSGPIKGLMKWMEDGGMFFNDVVAMLIYYVAAEYFRRNPDNAEEFIRLHFDLVLADLTGQPPPDPFIPRPSFRRGAAGYGPVRPGDNGPEQEEE